MDNPETAASLPPAGHPYATELEAERRGWYEVLALVRSLTPRECIEPGYYHDPDWTVRDVVAHLGTWLAEAQVQFERITAGTYEGHDVDIDGLNATLLEAMAGQPWEVAWLQTQAARTRMLDEWRTLADAERRGRVVDPQGRQRALRRAPRSACGVDRGAASRGGPRASQGPAGSTSGERRSRHLVVAVHEAPAHGRPAPDEVEEGARRRARGAGRRSLP